MSDEKDLHAAIDRLTRENAELNGLVLATGVILTQLLQAMTLREIFMVLARTTRARGAKEAAA